MSHLLNLYKRLPVTIVKGEGSYLYDENDKKYIDFTSGIATVNFGHCNRYIADKLKEQIDRLWHCSNLLYTKEQEDVAKRLADCTFADKVFFCSSGLEAIEATIKFVRKYFSQIGKDYKNRIITLKNGFHGRSIAGVSACGSNFAKKGFAPLLQGFDNILPNDIDHLKKAITKKTAAILLEPLQSEGGINVIDKNYLKELCNIAQENQILVCIDEAQTGFGRMAKLFHYQNLDIKPDILACAKGMGNGFPIGACLLKKEVAEKIEPGSHGGTYSGNPLAMTVCNAVLDLIEQDKMLEKIKQMSLYLKTNLEKLKQKFPLIIKSIKGECMLLGIEFTPKIDSFDFLIRCAKNGLLMTKTSDKNVIRILPVLTISKADVDKAVHILEKTLSSI